MNLVLVNRTIFVNLYNEVNLIELKKLRKKLFKAIDNNKVQMIEINITKVNFDPDIFDSFIKSYYKNYNIKLIIN